MSSQQPANTLTTNSPYCVNIEKTATGRTVTDEYDNPLPESLQSVPTNDGNHHPVLPFDITGTLSPLRPDHARFKHEVQASYAGPANSPAGVPNSDGSKDLIDDKGDLKPKAIDGGKALASEFTGIKTSPGAQPLPQENVIRVYIKEIDENGIQTHEWYTDTGYFAKNNSARK